MAGLLDVDQPGFDGQLEVAERVGQAGHGLLRAHRERVLQRQVFDVLEVVEFWQAPQTAPQPRRRAAIEQDRALAIGQHRHQGAFERHGFARFGDRVAGLKAQHVRLAAGFKRAQQAARLGARAECRAHVHHRLGVGVDAVVGGEAFGGGPQLFGHFGLARIPLLRGVAGQHAFDVAVQDRGAQAHADAGNRPCGGQPDAGQLHQFFDVPGEFAAVLLDDDLGGFLQVAGPGVVTQPRPQVQHFVFGGGGQRLDRRQ